VAHDYYYTLHSPENRELAELVCAAARRKAQSHRNEVGAPVRRSGQQMFPPTATSRASPEFGTADQCRDNCENCGAFRMHRPTKNRVVVSARRRSCATRSTIFRVGDFTQMLRDWLAGKLTNGEPVAHRRSPRN
jgi:methionyl-tRNA synthetase